ncbi:MAG: hypothetical protein ABIH11_04315 [Candidatus Altiarchaeota archaeon]
MMSEKTSSWTPPEIERKLWGWPAAMVGSFLGRRIPLEGDNVGAVSIPLTNDAYVKFLFITGETVLWVGLRDGVELDDFISDMEDMNREREEYVHGDFKEYRLKVDGLCDKYLNRIELRQGDVKAIYIPCGIPHAAGNSLSLQVHHPLVEPKDEVWVVGHHVMEDRFVIVEPQEASNRTFHLVLRDVERELDYADFSLGVEALRVSDERFPRGGELLERLLDYPDSESRVHFELIDVPPGGIVEAASSAVVVICGRLLLGDTPLGVSDSAVLGESCTLVNAGDHDASILKIRV